jgi:hypothetical protein
MARRLTVSLIAAVALMPMTHAADTPPPPATAPAIPADVVAMLVEHRGEWRTEGWIVEGEKKTPVKASWECRAAVNGVGNVCTWNHEWVDRPHDAAVDIMGYDPNAKVLRMQRVNDTGIMGAGAKVTVRGNTMTVVRESKSDDGKPRVMRNEIVVTKPGEWSQNITFDQDGKRVREWTMTQRRVKPESSAALAATHAAEPTQPQPSATAEIPAEIVAWLQGQRGSWRSEGVIIKGEERTVANATWECQAAVNGIGNVCTWNHQWTDRPHDSALEVIGYDPSLKMLSNSRVTDSGIMGDPVAVTVRGNTVNVERQMTENGKPAVMRNEIVVKSPDERSQRMWVEVDGKVVREFIITHRRVK